MSINRLITSLRFHGNLKNNLIFVDTLKEFFLFVLFYLWQYVNEKGIKKSVEEIEKW